MIWSCNANHSIYNGGLTWVTVPLNHFDDLLYVELGLSTLSACPLEIWQRVGPKASRPQLESIPNSSAAIRQHGKPLVPAPLVAQQQLCTFRLL